MSNAPTYENRRFTRVPVGQSAKITLPSGQEVLCEIVELSFCGMRLNVDATIACGATCTVNTVFSGDKEVEFRIVVVSSDSHTVTAEVTGIKKSTFDDLRSLLLANTEMPGRVDTELIERHSFLPKHY